MRESLGSLPLQVAQAWEAGQRFSLRLSGKQVTKIFFCGLGGSAISGDIIKGLADAWGRYPFIVSRQDCLPSWVDSKTLVVLSSYSGETKEILGCFSDAQKSRSKMLIVTSGGRLEAKARAKKIPCITVPSGIAPRSAIGYLTFSLLSLLSQKNWIPIKEKSIQEVLRCLKKPPVAKAKKIAEHFENQIVRLVGVEGLLAAVPRRWKTQIEENAKAFVTTSLMPEYFHNEIEGWGSPKSLAPKMSVVFFSDRTDRPDIVRKREFAIRAIRKKNGRVIEVEGEGNSPLTRLMSLIYLGDWVSYELADRYGADASQIPVIDAVKSIK